MIAMPELANEVSSDPLELNRLMAKLELSWLPTSSLPVESKAIAALPRLLVDSGREMIPLVEATMPAGFKQMISAFEELPADKRRKTIDDALKRLREISADAPGGAEGMPGGTNRPPISPELEAQVRTIGLKTFYSQSSAQTKAELAPVLEELQRAMESGRMMRGR